MSQNTISDTIVYIFLFFPEIFWETKKFSSQKKKYYTAVTENADSKNDIYIKKITYSSMSPCAHMLSTLTLTPLPSIRQRFPWF